ncbi:MAG: acyl-CoA dehydrogenase [Acidobacteria bacterium]|nr:MAG: acyl-CoA dehydrogenase [Acidobacteriota bacterium]
MESAGSGTVGPLESLPRDEARQVMWRFAHRQDIQDLVRAARALARGPVARLVADGARATHEWTERKQALLQDYDRAGLTAAYLEPRHGGSVEGPRNLALALVAFELAWVDAGAATVNLAQHLALAPIHERGTAEQRGRYMPRAAGLRGQAPARGAFALTEPIPYAGVESGLLAGRAKVVSWDEGREPILEVDKRGRFITNMAIADFVVAAVDSGDQRIKGSCLVILEAGDEGVFDRGRPTRKLVHQLSSTTDPTFRLRVPAGRIIGGYDVRDGVIVPRFNHGEIIEAVFRRTRVTVALMTSAKLLSAVEPILRYQRVRFRGVETTAPGTPRYELGLQQREDALHRLLDVWATGEASASLGFAAARLFDELDPLERRADAILAERGADGAAQARAVRDAQKNALEFVAESARPQSVRRPGRYEALAGDDLVRFVLADAVAAVLSPACKLWNTGHGAAMMREAVSLIGGAGITEDGPGFLGFKWMDAQLEATYEGPEAVQRAILAATMNQDLFLAQFGAWMSEMRKLADSRPGTGACTLASAMDLWRWTLQHTLKGTDADGNKLYQGGRQGVTFPLADALCWLLAVRFQIFDTLALEAEASRNPALDADTAGLVPFLSDLCHVQAARAAGEVARICAEVVYGYQRHPAWDEAGCSGCYGDEDLADLEQLIPGIESTAGAYADVIRRDGAHTPKAGPCVRFKGMDDFQRLRAKLDGCLTGARLAKDRAAETLKRVKIPDALDYPTS